MGGMWCLCQLEGGTCKIILRTGSATVPELADVARFDNLGSFVAHVRCPLVNGLETAETQWIDRIIAGASNSSNADSRFWKTLTCLLMCVRQSSWVELVGGGWMKLNGHSGFETRSLDCVLLSEIGGARLGPQMKLFSTTLFYFIFISCILA